jgi:gliding motility-associated-like protein
MKLLPSIISTVLVFQLSAAIGQTNTPIAAEQKLNIYFSSTLFSDFISDTYAEDPFLFRLKNRAIIRKGRVEVIEQYVQSQFSFDSLHSYVTGFISTHPNAFEFVGAPKQKEEIPPHLPWIKGPGDPCTNGDFETCDFTGWDLYEGQVDGTAFGYINVVANTSTDQHIITTAGTDPVAPVSMINPLGGTCSVRLGNGTTSGYGAASLVQTFLVGAANTAFQYSYAAILEDPAGHTVGEKPFFSVRMFDQAGNPIICGEYQAYGGDGQTGWVIAGGVQYKDWTTVYAPLTNYVGQNVTVEFIVGDCGQGGHYGYAYIDASCIPPGIIASSPVVCPGETSTLTAPAGADSYEWIQTGETTQAIVATTTGTYDCVLTPFNGAACADTISITIVVSPDGPTADFTMAPNPACENELVNYTDQSTITGIASIGQWDWDFGDATTSALQNPTHTYATAGNYNVQLTVTSTDGCPHDTTFMLVIDPVLDATVTPAGPYCDTDPVALMTAVDPGGVWVSDCGICLDAAGNFNPATAGLGTWNISYELAGACGDTSSISIIVEGVSITSVSEIDPLCSGDCNGSISIVAPGATQFSIDGGGTFQAGNNFVAQCSGNFNITVQSTTGCLATSVAALVDPAPLTITFSAFDATCFGSCDGNAIVIPGGGTIAAGYQYQWTPGAIAGSTSPNASLLCAGVYSLSVVDDNGCQVDTLNWAINEPLELLIDNVVSTDELCVGDCQGTLSITSALAVSFEINGPGGIQTNATGNFNTLCAGNYTIDVVDVAGCPANSSGIIASPPPVILSLNPDTTICIGGSAAISANAGGGVAPVTVTWDNGLGVGNNFIVNPVTTTVYTAVATDANGCSSNSIPVIVNLNPPLAVFALSDQSICPGSTASISSLANGGDGGPYTYSWDNGLGIGALQNVSPIVGTTYTVTATDGCETPSASASVTITILPSPIVDLTPDTVDGCTPVEVVFSENGQPVGTQCFWDFGDGSASTDCGSVTHVYTAPGCYDVTLDVISPDGCPGSITYPSLICVYAFPIADFSFGPQPTTVVEPTITFTNESSGASIYDWTFDPGVDPGTSTDVDPIIDFPSTGPGTYNVCLTATTTFGCQATHCDQVVIDPEFLVYTPNAFTPDGDGINDNFMPVISGGDPEDFMLFIFNRWGELIWRTDIMNKGWDGQKESQQGVVQEDVYVWKLMAKDVTKGDKHEWVGHVTLLR